MGRLAVLYSKEQGTQKKIIEWTNVTGDKSSQNGARQIVVCVWRQCYSHHYDVFAPEYSELDGSGLVKA